MMRYPPHMTSHPLKLVSINIEGHKHLELVLPFLKSSNADVICLQEVYEPDFSIIAKTLNMKGVFAPMTLLQLNKKTGPHLPFGIGMLSALPLSESKEQYYYGSRDTLQFCVDNIRTMYKVLVSGVIQKDGIAYTVGTTHFTWTPDGEADVHQRHDIKNLLSILGNIPEIVFCGDFNAPRGREIFSLVAARYNDNIPQHYHTSLDPNLHYAGPKLKVMVDALFSTPHYRTADVRLVGGVSDHCAIVAEVLKS